MGCMRYPLRFVALVVAALSAFGCGKAEVGEHCDEPGTTAECEDGAVCTNEDGGGACRHLCDATAQCPAAHSCNGVSGTNVKSCQPVKAK